MERTIVRAGALWLFGVRWVGIEVDGLEKYIQRRQITQLLNVMIRIFINYLRIRVIASVDYAVACVFYILFSL